MSVSTASTSERGRFLELLQSVLDATRHEPMFHEAILHWSPASEQASCSIRQESRGRGTALITGLGMKRLSTLLEKERDITIWGPWVRSPFSLSSTNFPRRSFKLALSHSQLCRAGRWHLGGVGKHSLSSRVGSDAFAAQSPIRFDWRAMICHRHGIFGHSAHETANSLT